MPDQDGRPWWMEATPAKARRVEGGIQINSMRGAVARTWWSERFIQVLESLGVGGRLARGRTYARQGQIVSLDVDAGSATAQVQGTRPRPYKVRIGVPAFGKAEWGEVTRRLAEDASYAAALLNGDMPRDIETVFVASGLTLFPASARDLSMDCSCPDVQIPCKHLAAVFYVLAERFDADPFAILALRGRDRATLLDELRERRSAAEQPGRVNEAPPLADVLEDFFESGPAPGMGDAAPLRGPHTPSDTLLDQVPAFGVTVRGLAVTELLRPAYRALGGGEPTR